jgi:hypothetical protein
MPDRISWRIRPDEARATLANQFGKFPDDLPLCRVEMVRFSAQGQ